MSEIKSLELRVSVDVGSRRHSVAVGLPDGRGVAIKALESKIKEVANDSKIAKILLSIPGFGPVCSSELAGEIGTVERFSKEGSLALYLGWRPWTTVRVTIRGPNNQARQHARQGCNDDSLGSASKVWGGVSEVLCKETQRGKEAQPGNRALGRHLCRIIYKMLKDQREYQLRSEKGDTRPRSGRDRRLKRLYGGRKSQRAAKNRKILNPGLATIEAGYCRLAETKGNRIKDQ